MYGQADGPGDAYRKPATTDPTQPVEQKRRTSETAQRSTIAQTVSMSR